MKITTSQLKKMIKEAVVEQTQSDPSGPRAEKILGLIGEIENVMRESDDLAHSVAELVGELSGNQDIASCLKHMAMQLDQPELAASRRK